MKTRNILLSSALVLGLAASGVTVAQIVNQNRHPNLAAAQVLIDQAYAKITAAEQANEFDMGGHAANAKHFLSKANAEIQVAARAADRNRDRDRH
jgi:hypothetical protein